MVKYWCQNIDATNSYPSKKPPTSERGMESCSIGFVNQAASKHAKNWCKISASAGATSQSPYLFRPINSATTRTIRSTQSPQRVHPPCSTFAPRHSESDPTRPKSAEGSHSMLTMCAAPQPQRFNTPKVRRGLISILKIRTAPQREQPNTPNVHRGFTNLLVSELARRHSESALSKDTEVGARLSCAVETHFNITQGHDSAVIHWKKQARPARAPRASTAPFTLTVRTP